MLLASLAPAFASAEANSWRADSKRPAANSSSALLNERLGGNIIFMDFEEVVKAEKMALQNVLEGIRASAIKKFNASVNKFYSAVEKGKPSPEAAISFCDSSSGAARSKLTATSDFKQLGLNIHQQLVKQFPLDPAFEKQAKQNFDLICDYSRRKAMGIEGKDLYTSATCRHLLHKTFKKTYHGLFDLLYANYTFFDQVQKGTSVSVDAIGGGPGSDLLAAVCFLMQRGGRTFNCTVWDYNFKHWQQFAEGLAAAVKKESAKMGLTIEISINYRHIDIKSKEKVEPSLLKSNLVTCCWVLNESDSLSCEFWEQVVDGGEGVLAVVEGESGALSKLEGMARGRGGIAQLAGNPRTLFVRSRRPSLRD